MSPNSSRIRSQQDLATGLLFLVIGGGFAAVASRYPIGTAARMGPGFFPLWMGIALAGLGVLLALRAVVGGGEREAIRTIDWRAMLWVSVSTGLFAVLLVPAGVLIATFVLVMVSASASHEFRWKASVAVAVALMAFVYVVFVRLLDLPIPLLPLGFR